MNDIFKALADPTRRQILRMLQDSDLSAGEIAKAFSISAPSISHHLNILKAAHIVLAQRDGQSIVYMLNTTVMHDFVQALMEIFQIQERTTDDEQTNPVVPAGSDVGDGDV